ncbi:hypothetical protein BDV93DRAFT_563742 [Ceratobasidium sp. AG-I]|nr:hypothetical protein BDV93DRAFT_563742 [Ceratobasidium sp. AG-I]
MFTPNFMSVTDSMTLLHSCRVLLAPAAARPAQHADSGGSTPMTSSLLTSRLPPTDNHTGHTRSLAPATTRRISCVGTGPALAPSALIRTRPLMPATRLWVLLTARAQLLRTFDNSHFVIRPRSAAPTVAHRSSLSNWPMIGHALASPPCIRASSHR